MTEEEALLAAVLANRADDLPRLVYCDWLDEDGQTERAEFIRTQIELAKLGHHSALGPPRDSPDHERYWDLKERATGLFKVYAPRWFGDLRHRLRLVMVGEDDPDEIQVLNFSLDDGFGLVDRGFVGGIRSRLNFLIGPGPCEGCYGSVDHGYAGYANWAIDDCPNCGGCGRQYAAAPPLYDLLPLDRFEVDDCVPVYLLLSGGYRPPGWNASQFPGFLFALIEEQELHFGARPGGRYQNVRLDYKYEREARQALSAALVEWCRRIAARRTKT